MRISDWSSDVCSADLNPAGVVNVNSGADPQVGAVLTTDPDVDMVTFTGSTPTGRAIMAAASSTLKKVFLELGGKSAAILLDDADFGTDAMIPAFSMVTHGGQELGRACGRERMCQGG